MALTLHEEARSRFILGMRVDGTSYQEASRRIVNRARQRGGGYVCIANVHMVMEAHDDASYRRVVNGADLVTPDGVPLVWTLQRLGVGQATRVYGPDLMLAVLAIAEREGVAVGLLGSTPEVLAKLQESLADRFPKLEIAYRHSPPFGPTTDDDDARLTEAINGSGARILFVGLGCPRQERWMAAHEGRIEPVMLGVGAAFDFLAGCKPQAPGWMQAIGMEWLFRLITEPRRLWRRYAKHNPRFLALVVRQVLSRPAGSKGTWKTT